MDVAWVKSYIRDIDVNTRSTHIQIVRQQGTPPVEQKEIQDIAADSAWSKQFELWMIPYVFVKAAMAGKATTTTQTIFARKFAVVTFTVQNKYKVSGFINDQNLIEKIQAWIDPNDTLVETTFRDYKDFHRLQFPSMIIEKQAGELALVMIVNDVTH